MLSKEFLDEFSKGHRSIQSLSLNYPHCGGANKVATFAVYERNGRRISETRCPSCKNPLVPDSSIIRRRLLSSDLKSSREFENFTILLPAIVRKECDNTKAGRNELNALSRFASMGRIKLEYEGRIEDIPNNLSNTVKDEMIVDVALK